MSRWIWFCSSLALGFGLLICGLLMPVHLRAVDVSVLWKAGRNTATLSDRGLALIAQTNLGAAQLLLQTAQAEKLPGRAKLSSEFAALAIQHPNLLTLGRPEPLFESWLSSQVPTATPSANSMQAGNPTNGLPSIELVVRLGIREQAHEFLQSSRRPAVRALIECRSITNTTVFSPSQSASGQALDGAIALVGLLIERGYLTPVLKDRIFALTAEANRTGRLAPVEQVLLDFLSLGQRLNWGQLTQFVSQLEDTEALARLTAKVRENERSLPTLFSAVELSGQPAAVARYLMNFSQTGLSDLRSSLRFGAGGLEELLRRNQRLCDSPLAQIMAGFGPGRAWFDFGADYAWHNPWLALGAKWLLYLGGGFWLAMAMRLAKPAPSALERPLQVRGLHVAREILFALGFLLVVLLLSEPFLAQESQRMEMPFRLRLPTVGGMIPAGSTSPNASFMNQIVLLTLLLFFVLQALLYLASLVKLAEIRRQRIVPRMKLKLLENEDHLFDAGLYLGFVGTIISLILVSVGVIKPSLMAAYSSTSFGIIFVSIFKIFHLRPLRRTLLLEAELNPGEPVAPLGRPSLATPS